MTDTSRPNYRVSHWNGRPTARHHIFWNMQTILLCFVVVLLTFQWSKTQLYTLYIDIIGRITNILRHYICYFLINHTYPIKATNYTSANASISCDRMYTSIWYLRGKYTFSAVVVNDDQFLCDFAHISSHLTKVANVINHLIAYA